MTEPQASTPPEGTAEPVSRGQMIARYDFFIDVRYEHPRERSQWADVEDQLVGELRERIMYSFADRARSLLGESVYVEIAELRSGSVWGTVVLGLGAGVAIYQFLSQYRDFYDSLVLLREHLTSLIDAILQRYFGKSSSIIRKVTLTKVPIQEPIAQARPAKPERPKLYSESFFWYLLVMNLVLLIIIGMLVYRAVSMTYFGTP